MVEISGRAGKPALIGIYRRRNAPLLGPIADAARAAGWRMAWWALDNTEGNLANDTVGVGQGTKLPLLNEIVARAGLQEGWLVVSDDDVVFTQGDVVGLVDLCAKANLDLAQPARSDDNSVHEFNVAHPITAARKLSRIRTTTFVESGPLFVVGPRWRRSIVPFPEQRGMGWGVELDWHELHRRGCRLGIIDAIRVAHQGEPGGDYDFDRQVERMHAELRERGFEGWNDLQHSLETWWAWHRAPPWSGAAGSAE